MFDRSLQLVGCSYAIRSVREELQYAARSDAKVLVSGESGVGKEIVAGLVHMQSARAERPILTLNCAGVPDTLLESELFGHVRGSFTGAYRDKPGLLEMAQGGTIFLDEVGETSLRMQALLLRFLETGELQRVGGDLRASRVDVRVVAATNRNLVDCIGTGQFREDLYYRLNVIHLTIPPLRERREDIAPLFQHFLRRFSSERRIDPPGISAEAAELLAAYDWPGNGRELRNIVERLLVRAPKGMLMPADLPEEIRRARRPAPDLAASPPAPHDRAAALLERLCQGESFWSAVYEPFMARDLTRDDLRRIIGAGLKDTNGSYRILTERFNMKSDDYKRFLNFLRKHDCHLPFHQFRTAAARVAAPVALSALGIAAH